MEDILIDVTDRTVLVFIPDPASTTGVGKTGLNAAALTCTYTRVETDNDVVHTDVTSSLNNLSALTDAHNDWGLLEVSATLSKGLYRLDIADAVFDAGAWYAVVQVTITSGTAAATPKAFRLVSRNDLDGVRLGLTALPNAAAEAAGGLYTRGSGAGQINQNANGQVDTNVTHAAGTAWASGAITAAAIADGAIDEGTFATTAGSFVALGIVDQGTAQSIPDTTHLVIRAASAFETNVLAGKTLYIVSATTGAGQSVIITSNVTATDTVAFDALPVALTGTVVYKIFATAPGSTGSPPAVNIVQISGDSTAADNAESFFDGNGYDGSANDIGTVTTLTNDPSGVTTLLTRLGTPSNLGGGATVAANLSDIEGQTDDIGTAGAGLTAVPWNASWDAEVQSEVDDGLVARGLDHLVAASVTGTDITDNSIIARLASKSSTADWDTYNQTTDSLEANRDNIGTAGASLTSVGLVDGAITAAKIGADAITAAKIADGAIDANTFAAGAITASAIATDAIGDAEVAADSVTAIATGVWAAATRTLTGSQGIKKNTALAAFEFVMTDSTNHVPTTGFTVTATRSLDGAAFAACANAVSEIASGWYKIDLAAADLNGDTVGLKFTATGADALNIALVTSP